MVQSPRWKRWRGKKEIFAFAKEQDAEMRRIIDGVFEAPVSESVFGGMRRLRYCEWFSGLVQSFARRDGRN